MKTLLFFFMYGAAYTYFFLHRKPFPELSDHALCAAAIISFSILYGCIWLFRYDASYSEKKLMPRDIGFSALLIILFLFMINGYLEVSVMLFLVNVGVYTCIALGEYILERIEDYTAERAVYRQTLIRELNETYALIKPHINETPEQETERLRNYDLQEIQKQRNLKKRWKYANGFCL
ncbi:MAG: hypothetical protein LRY46_03230 [Candidatus Pacebacteria bacterium]|nr:hypothetical protein [Candidatus Paceibacterota bacterium]MCD8508064.1 hypothetical protein [Candidatus Paceibacterota bacterium]MCD8563837.1 hypothetical protein [Candidatus Paceibacterota bacterium]